MEEAQATTEQHGTTAGGATHHTASQHDPHAAAGNSQHAAHHEKKESLAKRILNKDYIKAGIIYLVAALIVFYPLAANMANTAPGVGGDTYLNLWNIWWVNYATFTAHTGIYFSNLVFWPVGANLIFQTMPPLFALFSAPFQAVSVPFAYNVMFFAGFVVAGLGMMALADYIVKNKYAAFFAGVIFAFSAFHIAQATAHIEFISIGFAPIAVLFLLKLIKEDKKYVPAVGLAVSFVLILVMAGIESTIMASMFLFLLFIAYAINGPTRKQYFKKQFWMAIALFIVLALVIGSPVIIPTVGAVLQPGSLSSANYLNTPQENTLWSPDLASFFLPSYYNGIFNGLAQSYAGIYSVDPTERIAYIGYVALIFAAYGVYRNWKSNKSIKLWLALGIIFFLITLGPDVQIAGSITGMPGLYSLYAALPAINVIREPGRFDMYVTLVTAVLAAIGMKTFLEKHPARSVMNMRVLTVVFAAIFLFESAGVPLSAAFISQITTPVHIPAFYYELGNFTANFSVLSLPAFEETGTFYPSYFQGQALYYMHVAQKPLVGGVATRQNESQTLALYNIPLAVQAANLQATGKGSYQSPVNESLANETVFTLYNYNTAFVVLNRYAYNQTDLNALDSYLGALFGNPVYEDNTTVAFQTLNAINSSIYKSYVAYPQFSQWQPVSASVGGNATNLWVPAYPGEILVYAPLPPGTTISQQIYSHQAVSVNTTVTFQAASSSGTGTLYLNQASGSSVKGIATFNVTQNLQTYSANMVLAAGTSPNILLFAEPQLVTGGPPGGTVGIANIKFSRDK